MRNNYQLKFGILTFFIIMSTVAAQPLFSDKFQLDSIKITSNNNLSYNVVIDALANGVILQYDSVNTLQRPFGRLIEDFSVLDYMLNNFTKNTTIDFYIIDDGFILKGLNLTYQYKNGGTDFFEIKKQFRNATQGLDVREYDSIGLMMNGDVAGRHQIKFRLYSQNGGGTESNCESKYRVLNSTQWIDFTASFHDLTKNCDFKNIHAVSFFVDDVTNNGNGVVNGSFFVDEWYLRKNTQYFADDFEYYQQGEKPAWQVSSAGTGDGATLSLTTKLAYAGNKSLNATYTYNSGSGDFVNIQRNLSYVIDINKYKAVGFWFKADVANRHMLKARVREPDTTKFCDTPYTNATSTSWSLFEWNITQFDTACNLSNIERVELQLNDRVDSTSGTGSVYLDNYFLRNASTTQRIEFNFINESIRTNQTLAWNLCVNTSGTLACSANSSFSIVEYSSNPAASLRSDSGNLTSRVTDLNIVAKNTQAFVRANLKEREVLVDVVQNIERGELTAAVVNASAINYTIVNFTHLDGRTFYLVENSTKNRGWAYFVFAPSAQTTHLFISVPHPIHDARTPQIGTDAFLNASGKWLFVAGAHRDANFNEIAEPVSDNNRVHPYYTTLVSLVNSNASIDVLEMHGFSTTNHPTLPNATLSYGNATITEISQAFKRNITGFSITADIYNGTNFTALGGTRNLIGKYIRSIGADFIHTELSELVRQNMGRRNNFTKAVTNTWLAG